MSITEAFEGVIPTSPAPEVRRRPSPRPRPAESPTVVPIRPAATRARTRPSRVRRLARVVYLDGRDSWIAEERSPSAKTVWKTRYADKGASTAFRTWDHAWRPAATLFALLVDAIKFLLINPVLGPLTLSAAALYITLRLT